MKENKKTYWKGLEQLSNDAGFVKHADKEFAELPTTLSEDGNSSRRDFLKVMGFSLAAATLAACEAPVRKAIPYVNKPVDINPSIPNYYASTFASGGDYASIVVKTREGRPIKIDGNELSPISKGGSNAIVQAAVLSLYDKQRLAAPMVGGAKSDWKTVDEQVKSKLASAGAIKIVTNSLFSPTTEKAIQEFAAAFGNVEVVTYDPRSNYGIAKAAEATYGQAMVPDYRFDNAKVIVSFGADFLGTWISPIEFSQAYTSNRKVTKEKPEMSRHYQFESNLSLAGANADYRTPIKASQSGLAVLALYNALAKKAGVAAVSAPAVEVAHLEQAANDLWAAKELGLVISGSNDPNVQIVINAINDLLGANGSTVDFSNPVNYRKGDDAKMAQFVADLGAGGVGGVIFYNCNPVYDHPQGAEIAAGIAKAKVSIATNGTLDETASLVQIVAPDHHFLESWNDYNPKKGLYSLAQPTISPLFATRQAQDSFLTWSGNTTSYYDYLQANWTQAFFPAYGADAASFQEFWDRALYNGVVGSTAASVAVAAVADTSASAAAVTKSYAADNAGAELVVYTKVGMGDGTYANNPWLQEMSDPITKATWDNYLTVSQRWANENGVSMVEENTKKAQLTVNGKSLIVPILIQPGQAYGTFGLAIGYGRTAAGRAGNGVGVNAYNLLDLSKGFVQTDITAGVEVAVTGESYKIARTQTHQTFMGRENVIQETTLGEYKQDASAGRYKPEIYKDGEFVKPSKISLWSGHKYSQHHWGLAIDMSSCTGCGACTVACQVENNVAVVGKQEVLNRREMAWIRIDRYYSSDAPADDLSGMEVAAENPEVTFQPMMCQQCNNAPCETVCPVAATTHSSEGLNQMTYNRCIGTRYCANNCPYKVRRFNWFKYHDNKDFAVANMAQNDDLGKMVLNPDVTVRARGVMEKCSMCVQRIQAGKLEAKREKRKVKDGDINVACAQACPGGGLVFGDLNDPESRISKLLKIEESDAAHKEVGEERAYHVLEEINVSPNVWYFTKIRNKEKNEA
ncbi:TAT-variant-translocated molybdopterin oxidoreductase [Algoriphagus aestuariicola]|uniref:TAT-variant-translocated molybdopterin oxidoreductase n=1 Tax=Algoriphagus aestuariicola TaxID=1852016 RepID=A0ABS3BJY3_9BACT|nr:TAT-variant-translocated molybdopterin oxidoreductase [Algoriphagus aestuariicola]MBN7799617.1 TAT-variant-translocated molybdopterin oxidoreductase [Algoriphagus aestuariicola]